MKHLPTREHRSIGDARSHLGRASAAVLLFVSVLLVASIGQVAYRLSLPTEGWAYSEDEVWSVVFTQNLLGEPSPLRPGDRLRAVEEIDADRIGSSLVRPIADGWRAGAVVRYTVVRGGRTLDLAVPLKRWTIGAVLRQNVGTVGGASTWLATLLMLGIGLFVLLRRPEEAAARALLLLSAVWFASDVSFLVPDGPSTQLSRVWPLSAFFGYWIFGILIGPTVLALALVFPSPKRILRRLPWLIFLPYLPFWLLVAALGWRPEIGWGLTLVYFVLALLSVLHSTFTARDAVSRAQLFWGLGGFLAAIALFLPAILLGFVGILGGVEHDPGLVLTIVNALSAFAFPAFTACLAVAIVRYRLFDIDLIIRRTFIYGLLTGILALLYLGSVAVLQSVSRVLTGGQAARSQWVVVVSTLAIAALFQPLRRRIRALIDRRFYRRRYDASLTLASYGASLRDEVDLQPIARGLVLVVQDTMQPVHASLWLRPPEGHV